MRWRVVEKGASEKPANEKVTDRKWIPLIIFLLMQLDFWQDYHLVWLGFDIKTNGLQFQIIIVTTMSELPT